MRLQGVIFDLDGTLANTLPVCYAAFRKAYRAYLGRDFTDMEIRETFGPSEEGSLQRLIPDHWEAALQIFLDEYEAAHALCPEPFEGAIALLSDLRLAGVRLAIVTGKGQGSADISLRRTGLAPYFERIEVGSPKGSVKALQIRALCEHWGLAGDQVGYVGDVASDMIHAREGGAVPLGAAWAETAEHEALESTQPAGNFRSFAELRAWLWQERLT